MKLWVDDMRPAPDVSYHHCRSVNDAKRAIEHFEELSQALDLAVYQIFLIDIDHDAGEYAIDGGDYIKLLDWLEETSRNYPIRIHSMNPVGRDNMKQIIHKNNWREIL